MIAQRQPNINELRIAFHTGIRYAVQHIDIIRLYSRTCGICRTLWIDRKQIGRASLARGCISVALWLCLPTLDRRAECAELLPPPMRLTDVADFF
jgi:hypothetical protein